MPPGRGPPDAEGLLGRVVDVGDGAVALGDHQEVRAGLEHAGEAVGAGAGRHLGRDVGERGHEPVVRAVLAEHGRDAQLAPRLVRRVRGQVVDAGLGVDGAHPDRERLAELIEARPRVTISSTCSGARIERQLSPGRSVGLVEQARPAAVGVDDVAVGVGAQHRQRPGVGDRLEQLAHVVELAAQLLGLGHVEAGAGVALERALAVEERQGPVVQPAALAVGARHPHGELERHPVADVLGDALGRPRRGPRGGRLRNSASPQVVLVGPDAEELEARAVADARASRRRRSARASPVSR